jgi:acyl-CoA reductase-like NAD-dependent aldehyde dehydrogenase
MERAAAGTFTGLGLELGGKDPGYVRRRRSRRRGRHADGRRDVQRRPVLLRHRAHLCRRERSVDAFVEKAVAWAEGYKLGNPLDPRPRSAPWRNIRFAREVRAQIARPSPPGPRPMSRAFAEDDGGAYLTPQVLTGVTHDMRVMRDESFGPVVGIMPVEDDDEAIRLMNDSRFGLTASALDARRRRAEAIGDRIETGTVS